MTTTNLTLLAGSAVTDFSTIRKHCGAIRSVASPTNAYVVKRVGSTPLLATASSTMKIVFAISLTYTALAASNIFVRTVTSFLKALTITSPLVPLITTLLTKILNITSGPTITLTKSISKSLSIISPTVIFLARALALFFTVLLNYNVILAKSIGISRTILGPSDILINKGISKGLTITSSLVATIRKRLSKIVSATLTNTSTVLKSPLVVFSIVSQTFAYCIKGQAFRIIWLIVSAAEISLIKRINPILSVVSPIILEIAKLPTKIFAVTSSITATLVKLFTFGTSISDPFLVTSTLAPVLSKILSLRVRISAVTESLATFDLTNYIKQAYTMTLSLICTPDILLTPTSGIHQRLTQALTVTCEISVGFYKTMSRTMSATTQGILDMIRSWG